MGKGTGNWESGEMELTLADADDGGLDIAERVLESKEKVLVGPGGEEFPDHFEFI